MCSDDCDQVHCKNCHCHTVGNELICGFCHDCFMFDQEEYNSYMEREYQKALKGLPYDPLIEV